ncbi:MAG: glycosyltransferase [Flavobacteriales bacterium]
MAFKILQITNKPPFPAVDGGCLEIAKMSTFFDQNENFDLDIFTVSTNKHPFRKSDFDANLSSETKVYNTTVNSKPTLVGVLNSFFSSDSYNLNRYVTKEIEEFLISLIKKNNYHFIQFESIYAAQFVSFLAPHTDAKFILNAPNVEFNLWKQQASKAKFLKKWYFNSLAKKLKRKELSIWRKMHGIVCITENIKNTISDFKIKTPTLVLPFALNVDFYKPNSTGNSSPTFFHIGAMDWAPNKEGINWFLSQIWDSLSLDKPIHLAGKELKVTDYNSDSVSVHGFVKNAQDFINSHDIMIVPLLSGSGMRIKIIEAMALEKCVISTSKGAEGIKYTDKENIWIADTADEFKQAITTLNSNLELAVQIGINGRKLVKNEYNTVNLESNLVPFYSSLK